MTSLFDFLKIQESTDYFVVATMKGLASYANSFLKNIPEERIFLAPGGEASKTFTVYEELLLKIARAKITRNGVIIGIGGGALLDVAGFAAATYLRGVPFYAIPTTLLAMVDAAIGGKTAINLPFAKNIVGAFAEPKSIVNHFPFLDTLSKKDWANGWSEVLKMGLLAGGELWSALKAHPRANNESLFQIIKLAQAFKTHVTTSDFRENVQGGVGRAQLNFGHTLGHALEVVSHYQLSHGAAVAIGIRFALWLSCRYSRLNDLIYREVDELLNAYELPFMPDHVHLNDIMEALLHDKKRINDRLQWVLLENIGKPILQEFDHEEVRNALEKWWALSDSNR